MQIDVIYDGRGFLWRMRTVERSRRTIFLHRDPGRGRIPLQRRRLGEHRTTGGEKAFLLPSGSILLVPAAESDDR